MKHKHKFLKVIFLYIPLGYIAASILLVTMLKWIPVAGTPLMLKRCFDGTVEKGLRTSYRWRPIEEISPNMIRSVIASEDQKFLTHNGFDVEEIQKMKKKHDKDGSPIRGCSTISQQTAKNCFTSGSRTWFRKIFEAYYTVLIEKIWGKKPSQKDSGMGRPPYGVQKVGCRPYGRLSGHLHHPGEII